MPTLISTRQLADKIGYSEYQICKMARNGQLPAYKVGRHWRFDPEEVLEAMRHEAEPQPARSRSELQNIWAA